MTSLRKHIISVLTAGILVLSITIPTTAAEAPAKFIRVLLHVHWDT